MSDATVLIRDIAGDAAQKAANQINPSEDKLNQIDEPADDNTWHDVPDLSAGNLKSQAKDVYNKKSPLSKQDLKDAAGDASQTADPNNSRNPQDAADKAAHDQQHGTSSGVDAQSGAKSGLSTLKDRASNNIDDEDKEKAKDAANAKKEQTKKYLSKKMPEERREQTIWRLKKMVVEIQGHPDYMQAVNTILNLAEEYAGHATNVANQSAGTVKGAHADSSLQLAEKDLKVLIERFANSTSLDDLFESIDQIYSDADKDPELKKWFKSIDAYIRKCLKQQGYILEDRATDEWNELYDRGNFLLRDRYRNHTDRIVDEVKFLADQFDADPQNKKFANSVNKLFTDLGNDENGKPTFKPHLVKDLTDVILPAALANVRYLPIPRIEYSDPMIDAVIENLVIEGDNLTPNAVEFASDNYWRWGRKNISNRNKNAVMISVSGIQLDLKDVSYYVKKKQGLPSVSDLGVLDIFLGGTGLSFKMKVSTADGKDRQNFFKVDKVDIDVKNFNIKVKQSKHKLLFSLFKPIMIKVMRPALQKVLEKLIKDKFTELDAYAYDIKKEADRAIEQAKNDPEEAQNIYSRYASAFQKKITENKKKAEEVAADKKANVAVTQHDSIFPQIKLPGGISSKATEYKELAAKGNKWESPIFSIGSASKSSNIPSPSKITRKSHNVTQGGVRGPQNIGNTSSMSSQLHDPSAVNNTASSGSANGSAGFSNQLDQAFTSKTAGQTGNSQFQTGSSQLADGYTSKTTGHTLLGANNPVMTGNAAVNSNGYST